MDARNLNSLAAEAVVLQRTLDRSKPAAIARLEERLLEARTKRAELTETFRSVCAASHYARLLKAPPEQKQLEQEIAGLEQTVQALRAQLVPLRKLWEPALSSTAKPHLDAAAPTIRQAIELVEGVAELYAVFDRFVAVNGIGSWSDPRSRRLGHVAETLRRLLKERENQ